MKIDRDKISYMVGARIRDFRNERGMSQEELALASEIHPAYLGRLERGEKCPTIDTLYKISQGLKVPISELLDVEEGIEPTHPEAFKRIQNAIASLLPLEAVRIAGIIVEEIVFLIIAGSPIGNMPPKGGGRLANE